MSGYNQRKRVVLPMTTPTPETAIVCPECGHPAFRHFLWFCDNSGGCKADGCECNKTAQQAVEKFIAQDRAETRRAALLEAAKAVCDACKNEVGRIEFYIDGYFHVYGGEVPNFHNTILCDAGVIHALLAQEQAEIVK